MAHFPPGVPSQTFFSLSDGKFSAGRAIANYFSLSDGKFSAGRAIANALSCFRWHIFGRAYHRKIPSHNLMVNFRLGVPLQTSFSSSDGTFPARLTVANIFFFIRWHISRPAYLCKLPFHYPMVNFQPGVPSRTHYLVSDGTFLAGRTIVNIFLIIRWHIFGRRAMVNFLFIIRW
jgi:hypothetical protein